MENKKNTKQILLNRFDKFDYQPAIKVARDKYCKELIKLLSDENFFKPPTLERRKTVLKKELELLYTIVLHKFLEKYRED